MDAAHSDALSRAVSAVLATPIAEFTFAQILDGLPTIDTYLDRYRISLRDAHPLRKHKQLCPGVIENLARIHSTLDLSVLNFQPRLVDAFQNAPEGSREFRMRLFEVTAVAIHQLAVLLFKMDTSLHKYDGVISWIPDEVPVPVHLRTPPPTFFFHPAYRRMDYYPEGLADMVGYWAENRILGGVVLFDRGESKFECKDVYFHSDRKGVTFRIYKLRDDQVETLWQFLRGETSSPLPIKGDKTNRDRVDPDDAIDVHGIFRDREEREIPVKDVLDHANERCVQHSVDYPEIDDERAAMDAFWAERE